MVQRSKEFSTRDLGRHVAGGRRTITLLLLLAVRYLLNAQSVQFVIM